MALREPSAMAQSPDSYHPSLAKAGGRSGRGECGSSFEAQLAGRVRLWRPLAVIAVLYLAGHDDYVRPTSRRIARIGIIGDNKAVRLGVCHMPQPIALVMAAEVVAAFEGYRLGHVADS